MKFSFSLSTAVLTLGVLGSSLAVRADVTPKEILPKTITVDLQKAYIPKGYDDNDRVQLVVEGQFPNSCYKVGPYATKVDPKTRTIHIQQQAYLYNGTCIQMLVPFSQVVDLGIIKQGQYKLFDQSKNHELGALDIDAATKADPDEYLYAPTTDAYITSDPVAGTHTLNVVGAFSDRCTVFEEIRVNYTSDVIIVQPVVKHIAERGCGKEKTRFVKTVELHKNLT
ncbi:MAG: hypothetical protein ACKOA8_07000, partial [Deltaproteobacteria bacterium]